MPTSEHDKRLRAELAAELGWYPADLDDESIARDRTDAARKKTDRNPREVAHLTELAVARHRAVEAARRSRGRLVRDNWGTTTLRMDAAWPLVFACAAPTFNSSF